MSLHKYRINFSAGLKHFLKFFNIFRFSLKKYRIRLQFFSLQQPKRKVQIQQLLCIVEI